MLYTTDQWPVRCWMLYRWLEHRPEERTLADAANHARAAVQLQHWHVLHNQRRAWSRSREHQYTRGARM